VCQESRQLVSIWSCLSDKCSFISYDDLNELLAQPNLSHMRETILEDFEEYFEPAG
jgi:hypothetical protein